MNDKGNIYQRINAVREAVAYVQKTKEVGRGNSAYKAVTHDAVTAVVREHLVEHGVIILPTLEEAQTVDTGTVTASSTPIIRYEATYWVEFVNIDNPEDKLAIRVGAHANDQGDKAPGKALSYATKAAILKVFSLETGEEDEDRLEAQAGAISDQQLLELEAVCDAYSEDRAILERMAQKVYGLEEIKQLPARYFDNAMGRLKKQLEETSR